MLEALCPLLSLSRKAETLSFSLNLTKGGFGCRPGCGELDVTERELVKGELRKGLPPAS